MGLRRHPLTKDFPLCISTNHEPPIEIPKQKKFYYRNREKTNILLFHHLLLGIENLFHEIQIG